MTNSTITTKISAAFLATVLVAGIIALSSPSFMVGAQAAPGYGMDSYDKKSYGKDNDKSKDSVTVKKVKCNNINVNVNGLDLNISSVPFLSGLLSSEASEGERGAGSYGSGEGSYGDKSRSDGDFKFICINNNNNTVIGGEDGVTPPPPFVPTDCIDCFTPENEGGQLPPPFVEQLEAYLMDPANIVPIGNDPDVNSIAELCIAIDQAAGTANEVTEAEIRELLNTVFPDSASFGQINQVIDCLDELGLITLTE